MGQKKQHSHMGGVRVGNHGGLGSEWTGTRVPERGRHWAAGAYVTSVV